MSRIGKYPVEIPQGVEIQISGQNLKAKGKLGELQMVMHEEVVAAVEDAEGKKVVRLSPRSDSRTARQIWPTTRTLVRNMVEGVSKGYTRNLEIHGVGKDPWGNVKAGFTAVTKINRADFGLTWNQAVEAGQLLVGDEVEITIEAEGNLKEENPAAA